MKIILSLFVLLVVVPMTSSAASKIISAVASSEQDVARLEIKFDHLVDSSVIGVEYRDQSIFVTVPETEIKKSFQNPAFPESFINQVNFSTTRGKEVVIELVLAEVSASQMKENVTLESLGNSLIIEVLPPIWNKNLVTDKLITQVPRDKDSEIGQGQQEKVIEKNQAEKEIPLFDKKTERSNESTGLTKIIFMVVGVSLLGGYLIWWLKNRSKMVNGPESLMKIKVVTQFHLGPKKSLAVVRVAGESMLLGITDTQISLIKTLALLDEDLPEISSDSFVEALKEQESPKVRSKTAFEDESERVPVEEFSFGPAVKTSLKQKIPGLRRIV